MITDAELQPSTVPNEVKMVRVPAGARKQIVFQLRNRDSVAVKLGEEVVTAPAEAPEFPGEVQLRPRNVTVKLVAKPEYGQPARIMVTGKWDQQNDGVVIFELLEEHTAVPGVYLAEVGQFTGDHLVESWPCYIFVEPSAFQVMCGDGPLTIAEIRMGLHDFLPDEVSLLDASEFTDVQIAAAARKVVELWNETPPDTARYTPLNFPYRYHWILGATAILLDMAAAKYRRDRLAYSAGGVSVDDQSKANEYQQMASEKKAEFKDWMMRTKLQDQMTNGWAIC